MGTTGHSESRLIILRGNSGSGKSALAAAVRAARPHRTVAVVGQDTIRREILQTGDEVGNPAVALIDLSARFALDAGFDVVVEGILNAEIYGSMLTTLVVDHRGMSACYLYDVPFEETVARHATRPNAADFGATEMRDWWLGYQPIAGLNESRIGPNQSLEESTAQILHHWNGRAHN